MIGQGLTLAAISLQSVGKVLYGTFLTDLSTPLFLLVGVSVTVAISLALVRFALPREGRLLLLLANLWTAISFIGLFYALKHLPPAVFAAIEMGTALAAAIAVTSFVNRAWPVVQRLLACAGIVAGCVLLAWTELTAATATGAGALVLWALAASVATGAASAFTATACRGLATLGWSSPAVLAHRFYLTIAIVLVWLAFDGTTALPGTATLGIAALIGTVAILAPLLLLQIALRRADELTVLICMAAQPLISFGVALPSPAYAWEALTLAGVVVVSAFVAYDVLMQHRLAARARPATSSAQP